MMTHDYFPIKRPGLAQHVNLSSPDGVRGLYYCRGLGKTVAVCGTQVYLASGGVATNISNPNFMYSATRPYFTWNGKYLFVSDGRNIFYTDGTQILQMVQNGPTAINSLDYIDDYILAGTSDGMRFSQNLDGLTWPTANLIRPRSRAGGLVAIKTAWRSVLMATSDNVESWYDSGDSSVFTRVEQYTLERGLVSSDAFLMANNLLYMVDTDRNVCEMQGNTPKIISLPISPALRAAKTLSDCSLSYLNPGGKQWILIQLPSANLSYVFDIESQSWYQFTSLDATNNIDNRFIGQCSCYDEASGSLLLGSASGGKIFYMSNYVYQDDGNPINCSIETAPIDHGTLRRKRSTSLLIELQRGIGQ